MKRFLLIFSVSLFWMSSLAVAHETVTYVDLVRYAWQDHYASERYKTKLPHIERTVLKTNFFVSNLLKKNNAFVHPMREWHSGSYYVTSVLLRNKKFYPIAIDVKHELFGRWKAAVLYPRSHLKPYGNKNSDSTLLFLVSSQPFNTILSTCHGHA